ncbi:MAG: RNA 2',3'-cyclic phosphodiesterase [bacterium]|nr:RNA 2',3'-cyclic phosphodiesterase [bacterium]
MHHARLFLAFDLNEQVGTRLLTLKPALERLLPGARWCRREALHLTVKFFGTLPLTMVSDIDCAVQTALAGHAPFICALAGLGGFPALARPRVLWAGVGDGRAQVCAVADDLLHALETCGFGREERDFTPHVTLARLAHRTAVDEAALSRAVPNAAHALFGATEFAQVSLYASELTPAGPRHTLVRQWPLPGA